MLSWLCDLKAGLGKGSRAGDGSSAEAVIWSPDQHPLKRSQIDDRACQVIDALVAAGYEAYLVGGGVRDLLLGCVPKDHDVVTNATPEQVLKCFKRARLIGRRFQLVHVVFGRHVIEVATFRRTVRRPWVKKKNKHAIHNEFGTRSQDALRRDFTVNALYYDLDHNQIIDYAGGMNDIQQRQFRMIGEVEERYREDPVRLLRAIRLMAKLDLQPDPATEAPMRSLIPLLEGVSPARLFDEVNKAFLHGCAHKNFYLMHDYGVLPILFPGLGDALDHPQTRAFIDQALINTDKRFHQGQSLNPCFLLSVILWRAFELAFQSNRKAGMRPYMAKQQAMGSVLKEQIGMLTIPKRLAQMIKEIWSFQYLLEQRRDRQVRYVIEQKRFRAAYDFLCLRADCDAKLKPIADWWTTFQTVDKKERRAMQVALRSTNAEGTA